MAITAHGYLKGIQKRNSGSIAWTTDTIKIALVTSAYTPNQDTDEFWSTPQAHEASGTGYTAGGITLTTPAVNLDAVNNYVEQDADDVNWSTASITARYAVIYKSTGVAGTSPLIGYFDFGGDETVTSGTLQLIFDATGIIRDTVS